MTNFQNIFVYFVYLGLTDLKQDDMISNLPALTICSAPANTTKIFVQA